MGQDLLWGEPGSRRRLALPDPLEHLLDRRADGQTFELGTQVFLHRLTLKGRPRGKLIPHRVRHVTDRDLHAHVCRMTLLTAKCKHGFRRMLPDRIAFPEPSFEKGTSGTPGTLGTQQLRFRRYLSCFHVPAVPEVPGSAPSSAPWPRIRYWRRSSPATCWPDRSSRRRASGCGISTR